LRGWLLDTNVIASLAAPAGAPLITTAKLNGLDSEAWLADVVASIADHPRAASTNHCPGAGRCAGALRY